MFLPPSVAALFPYTTLFRSGRRNRGRCARPRVADPPSENADRRGEGRCALTAPREMLRGGAAGDRVRRRRRSEEHTSELQSHSDLVCRLLLEKKKPRTSWSW